MLKPLLTIVLLLFLIQAQSQTKYVKRFHWLQPSLLKEMPVPELDQNEKKCAVIKVVGSQADFDFDFGLAGKAIAVIKNKAVTWLCVPAAAKTITVSSNKMGEICKYDFGQVLEPKEVYELELYAVKEQPKGDNHIETQWAGIMDRFNLGADFYVDNELIGQTPYFGSFPIGNHSLRMELNGVIKDTTIMVVKNVSWIYDMNFKPSDVQGNKKGTMDATSPEFPGGIEELKKFLSANIKYPTAAQESGIPGIVYVSFLVRETGRVTNIKILRGIFGACDEEVIRVIKAMPKWNPGLTIKKMVVPVKMQMPVAFQIPRK
jgi:TonB family protein